MSRVVLDPRLKSQRFRQEREADWRRLEKLVDKAETRGAASLTDDEILAVPVLYRGALSSLSVARETSLDRGLADYLETLCARAYFFVYGSRSTLLGRLSVFFAHEWPAAVRGLWRETLAAAALTVLGVVVAVLLIGQDPDWHNVFMPADLAQGRDHAASTESLRAILYDEPKGRDGLTVFATYLFTHNAQVALLAFAVGFAFGVPTALLLAYNGAMLGAIFSLYASRGLGVELAGWIFIHGVTELFAIVLAGAAGLHIGWAAAFPGERPRVEALAGAGRRAGAVMGGVVVMLFLAGLLEGFGRQLITLDLARYAVAVGSGLMWLAYFYGPRPQASMARSPAKPRPLDAERTGRVFVTPEGVDLRLQIADAGQRASAFILDAVIILIVLVALTLLAVAAGVNAGGAGGVEMVAVIWLLGFFLLRNFYFVGFELTAAAATPGKRVLGLRVAARDGGRLRAESVFARNALRELEVFMPLSLLVAQADGDTVEAWMYLLAFAWCAIFVFFPLFNRDRLRIGDLVGGTWVVRAPRQALARDMADEGAERLVRYDFAPAQLDAYGVKELTVLEGVLRARDRRAVRTVAERIRAKIAWTPGPEEADYDFLSAYYAGLRGRLESQLLLGRRRRDKHDV